MSTSIRHSIKLWVKKRFKRYANGETPLEAQPAPEGEGPVAENEAANNDEPAAEDQGPVVEEYTPGEILPAVGGLMQSEEQQEAVPIQQEAVPIQQEAVPIQQEAVPIQQEAVPIQQEAVPTQQEAVSIQQEAVSIQPEAVPIQQEAVPTQQEAVSIQPEAVPIQPEAAPIQPQAAPIQLEVRYVKVVNEKDGPSFAAALPLSQFPPDWQSYALCFVRSFDAALKLETSRLYVQPEPLQNLCRDVMRNYPVPLDNDHVWFTEPYFPLFHKRRELELAGGLNFINDNDSTSHLNLLTTWIDTYFAREIRDYTRRIDGRAQSITFDQLWTHFAPGEVVCVDIDGRRCGFRVHVALYMMSGEKKNLHIDAQFIDFDGENRGIRHAPFTVSYYPGTLPFDKLSVVPLQLYPNYGPNIVRDKLIERGRKFGRFIGRRCAEYDGPAFPLGAGRSRRPPVHVQGRIILDPAACHRFEPGTAFRVTEPSTSSIAANGELNDDDALVAASMVRGYSLEEKAFFDFYVENVQPIKWNVRGIEKLVLKTKVRKVVRLLVAAYARRRHNHDDDSDNDDDDDDDDDDGNDDDIVVEYKDPSTVCLLYGPQGVGKTKLASAIAEAARRPLLTFSPADFATPSSPRSLAGLSYVGELCAR